MNAESLSIHSSIDISESDFLIRFELWCDDTVNSQEKIIEVEKIVDAVKLGLKNGVESLDSLFLDEQNVNQEMIDPLKLLIRETLKNAGGKNYSRPVFVTIGSKQIDIGGKMSPKPDLSNFHPQPEVFTGKFVGFHTGMKELYFQTIDKSYVMNFSIDHVRLAIVTDAIEANKECSIRVHRTTNRRGNFDYAYLPDVPFAAASSSPSD
ncbi:MAG: hypothetical protein ACRD5H_03750 [Nitrososphaerales archaeon]